MKLRSYALVIFGFASKISINDENHIFNKTLEITFFRPFIAKKIAFLCP